MRIGTRGLRVYDDEKVLDAKYGFDLILVKEYWEYPFVKNGPETAKNDHSPEKWPDDLEIPEMIWY